MIALHSPNTLLQTGLRVCPPEKSVDGDPLLSSAVGSLQSGWLRNYREKWALFAYFGGSKGENSLQPRLRGGEGDIRTLSTGLNPARADVCVGYTESTV